MTGTIAILLLAISFAGAAHAAEPTADAARGARLFVTTGCYQCHGYVAQGGPGLRLAPNPKPAFLIATYIRNPAGEMPPYTAAVLSDQDIRDIHAFLLTIPAPPKASQIALLNDDK